MKGDYRDFIGPLYSCHVGYSLNKEIRDNAASGGIVTSVLIYLLQNKLIEGAVVSRHVMRNGRIDYEIEVVSDYNDITKYSSNSYFDIPLLSALNKIKSFSGRLAVVGLPCHIRQLNKLCEADSVLRNKIKYTLGLFCGNNCRKELLQKVFLMNSVKEESMESFRFRRKHISGDIEIIHSNGSKTNIPFWRFNMYRMLWFKSKDACIYCSDHTAEYADISVGDVFVDPYKNSKIKYSSIIARNSMSNDLLDKMCKDNRIYMEEIPLKIIYKSQKRILCFGKNLKARFIAGRLFGLKIKSDSKMRVSLNLFLAACIVLANYRLSKNKHFYEFIRIIPKPIVFLYLLVFKMLSNF